MFSCDKNKKNKFKRCLNQLKHAAPTIQINSTPMKEIYREKNNKNKQTNK